MILIIAAGDDPHARFVTERLREKGAGVARFDVAEFPRASAFSAWLDGDAPVRARARRQQGDIDFSGVRTVWLRRARPVSPAGDLSTEDQEFAAKEANAFLHGLATALGDRFWVNPFASALAMERGSGKLAQLEAARGVGLAIPRTLATNDPDEVRAFVRTCEAGAIYKPFSAPTRNLAKQGEPPRYGTVFTTRVDARALEEIDGVRAAPCIFQELVPKRVDLRAAVIGHKVFATEIHSQVDERSSLDFRRHYALGETPYFAHELPREIVERCLALNRRLDLVFGAFDFALTPDGRYVFLEVNQQGQFLWLEQMTGQPLLENFCEMLRQGSADYRCDAASHEPGLPELAPLE